MRCIFFSAPGIVLSFSFLFLAAGACVRPGGSLTADDSAEILHTSLHLAIVERQLPGIKIIEEYEEVVLLADPRFADLEIPFFDDVVRLDTEEIRWRAEQLGRFLYIRISCCQVLDNRFVEVKVSTAWAAPVGDKFIRTSGGSVCTLVLEFSYGKRRTSVGSVWLFNDDGSRHLDSSEPLQSTPGWSRVAGPVDYETAAGIHSSLKRFLEGCGVTVIDEGIAD